MADESALQILDNLIYKMDIDEKQDDNIRNKESESSRKRIKYFYESRENLIFDAIDGELYSNPNLTRLYTKDKSIKVVYRADWDKSTVNKVALISGGGSGHEPCFFGFVGFGMLTAAVCGEIFSSPTTKAIIAAMLAVGTKQKGVLLIITNYTGDVLNFTLAAKIVSTSYNIPCRILSLSDDIALPRSNIPNIGRRGLSGGVFIHKIAGYYSEKGYGLDEIYSICNEIASNNIGTVGLAGNICHLIGNKYSNEQEMNENILELGYGVHGEPGFMKINFDSINNILPKMFELFNDFSDNRNYLKFMEEHYKNNKNNNDNNKKLKIVIMVNNLGNITNIEMLIIKKYLLEYIYNGYLGENIEIERIYIGKFETSLDMKGFSISIMKVNDKILNALDFNINIKAWNKGEIFQIDALKKSINNNNNNNGDDEKQENDDISIFDKYDNNKNTENENELSDDGANILKLCIESVCKSIIENKDILNELDDICGDGDCGTTLEFGSKLLLKNINKFNFNSLTLTLRFIAHLLSDMGGSSGALYGYLFISASNECTKINEFNSISICKAFKKAILNLSEYSKAKQNDRTMLDVLIPSINKLLQIYDNNDNNNNHKNALIECGKIANIQCNKTKQMIAKFGRSSYVAIEIQKKCVDPGAKAVAIWINSIVDVISNNYNIL